MARPYWSGQITISLVSFSVKLFVATEAKSEIRFHQISRATGERVRHQKVLASAAQAQEDSGEETAAAVVGKDEIVKGYEYRKGEYVTIEPSELANLRVPSKHTWRLRSSWTRLRSIRSILRSRTLWCRRTIRRRRRLRWCGRR